MEELKKYNVYIFDYEGTLSEPPSKRLTLRELLYDFDFKTLLPNEKVYNFVKKIENKKIYVVGITETNKEIEQKNEWLKAHYPMIEEQNYIFVSTDYKKSEAILEIINKYNYDKNEILFIDDKKSHVEDVANIGIRSVLVEEI